MESGFSDVISKGACTWLHCVTSQLLAPTGLLRLSLLKKKAKIYAHALLDTDLRTWKDIFLAAVVFLVMFYIQSGTTGDTLGFTRANFP